MRSLQWLNPLYWLRSISHFTWCWTITIPWRTLGAAAPSLLALFLILMTFALTYSSDPRWRRRLVEEQLTQATRTGATKEIALLSRRLLSETPDDLRLQFRVATTLATDELTDQAKAKMQYLAFEKQYGPAAVWLLEKEYSPIQWEQWDDQKRTFFGRLLNVAAGDQPDNLVIKSLYADYLLSTGATEKALGEIQKLVPVQPGRALQGALILRKSGRESQAINLAKEGLRLLEKQGSESPDNVELALLRAQYHLFLAQYEAAGALLNKASKTSEDPRLRTGLAEVLVLWSRDQASIASPTERFARQLQLLNNALKLAPNHPLVVSDLMNVILQCADEKDPKVAQLRDILVQGIAPELAHFVRGTSAMIQGDVEMATLHLELAAKSLPSAPAVLNNLAVTIATQESPDLDRAMQLVDAALKQVPDQPYFHETKAQIQLRQKDYAGAIVSFEKSLPAEALRAQVHEGLEKAYAALGQTELAEMHQQQRERLKQLEEGKEKN